MSKPWHKPSWRKKREEFIKGKSCEWCSSKGTLVIHHNEHFYDNEQYPQIAFDYFMRYIKDPSNKDEYGELRKRAESQTVLRYVKACPKCGSSGINSRKTKTPEYRCTKCTHEFNNPMKKVHRKTLTEIRKRVFKLFMDTHREDIDDIFEENKTQSDSSYLAFENVTILCKRCHMAVEKGLVLCQKCKKRYHKPTFEMCKTCYLQTPQGLKVSRNREKLPYSHPWCKKEFLIERQFWELQSNPQTCCFDLCPIGLDYTCDIALNNWASGDSY
jgi:hypothetical protein